MSGETKYLYDLEGARQVGTIDDYAKALEVCELSGLEIGPLLDLHGNIVPIEWDTYEADDWRTVYLTVTTTEKASYRIDLRA